MKKKCKICGNKFNPEHKEQVCPMCSIDWNTPPKMTRAGMREYCLATLGNQCERCGNKRHYLLEFHHKNPKMKDNTISRLIKDMDFDGLQTEIEKCILLCANCHKEFHWLERHKKLKIKDYLRKR